MVQCTISPFFLKCRFVHFLFRSYLTTLMMSNQAPVTLSCFVSQILVKDQIKLTFKDSDLKWHYLEVGESRESFHQCIIELISMMEESHGEMPVPTLKKYHLLPNRSVLVSSVLAKWFDRNEDTTLMKLSHNKTVI